MSHQHVFLASAELTIHYSTPAGENAGREWSPYLTWWSLCSGRTVKSRIEAEQNCQASQRGPHDRHFFFLGSLLQTLHNLHAPQNRHCPHLDCILPFYFSCVEQIFYILYTSQKIIKIRPAAFCDTVPWHPAPILSLSGMFKIYFLENINLKHTKLIVDGGECHAANSGNKPGSTEKGHSQQLQQFNLFKKAQINPDTIVKSLLQPFVRSDPLSLSLNIWRWSQWSSLSLARPMRSWSLLTLLAARCCWSLGISSHISCMGGGGRRERLWMLKFWCDCWGL